jgi:uncharacterized repeat protein (TIGR03803 family)
MRQNSFALAASCIVAATALLLALASGAEKPAAEKPASERIIYSFGGGSDGANPQSDLILDSAGNLYGTTRYGGSGIACGSSGCGTVFELKRSQSGWKEEVLHGFAGGIDGIYPAAGLVLDNAGNLYGTTVTGGANYEGTVFRLTPNTHGDWTESILYTFDSNGSAGTNPTADLVFDSHGNLYGTTEFGASGGKSCNDNGCGAVFELTPQTNGSWTETTVHVFTDTDGDGATPSSGVVLDDAGNVYGATVYGGTGTCQTSGYPYAPTVGCGTIYRATLSSGTWTETVLYNFARGGGHAVNPSWGLILINTGDLLATSLAGGDGWGTVFELKELKKGWEQGVLHRFSGNPDGNLPVGKVEMGQNGDLFGVTSNGGSGFLQGMVFELKPSETGTWKERILHSFVGGKLDGDSPQAGVVVGPYGNLYGTTYAGGSGTCNTGCGTVYEITP